MIISRNDTQEIKNFMNDGWRRFGASAELLEGKHQHAVIEDVDILVVRIGGVVQALSNRCTHAEACLHEGRLRGHRIICPLHGASFDARNGHVLARPAVDALQCYEVRESDGEIQVRMPSARP